MGFFADLLSKQAWIRGDLSRYNSHRTGEAPHRSLNMDIRNYLAHAISAGNSLISQNVRSVFQNSAVSRSSANSSIVAAILVACLFSVALSSQSSFVSDSDIFDGVLESAVSDIDSKQLHRQLTIMMEKNSAQREQRRKERHRQQWQDLQASHRLNFVSDVIRKAGGDESLSDSLAQTIISESERAGFDPLFVASVIRAESTFNSEAVSNRGAKGLMQIMPETGNYIAERQNYDWYHGATLTDARYNIRLGLAYLKYLERYFGNNREHILVAYNWGPGNLLRALKNKEVVPECTRKYARKVLDTHAMWSKNYSGQLAMIEEKVRLG